MSTPLKAATLLGQNPAVPFMSMEELSRHKQPDDLYVAINDKVYDVTEFHKKHPGIYFTGYFCM